MPGPEIPTRQPKHYRPSHWKGPLVLLVGLVTGLTVGSVPTALVIGNSASTRFDSVLVPIPKADAKAPTQADERESIVSGFSEYRPEPPAWQKHALSVAVEPGRPLLAVVIDDMGLDRARSARTIALPGPLTLSFLTYASDLPVQTEAARAAGHEIMAHVSMEPSNPHADPGPVVLLQNLTEREIRRRLSQGLSRFSGYVGVNNHMGSRFTSEPTGMAVVMSELRKRGLLFLDSLTTPNSVGVAVAQQHGVPSLKRDVFLDHDPAPEAVRAALATLENLAMRRGFAIGIGHPRDATISALAEWLPTVRDRGFALVPISSLVRLRYRRSFARTQDRLYVTANPLDTRSASN